MSTVAERPATQPAPPGEPARSDRAELLRLALGVAALIGLGYLAGYGETVLLILLLVGCIVAHEFGHFVAAKSGRVKVTEFFVGFGPRLWSVRKGETEYGVKALPLGGYCRIIGMNNLDEVDGADEPRTYRSAPLWRRLLIDVAGSSMHFVIALGVLFAMFFWTGDQGYYLKPPPPPAAAPIASIITKFGNAPSPAQLAGFRLGDRIQAVDGRRFASWDDQTAYIHARAGQQLDVTVLRSGRLIHLTATPQVDPCSKQAIIGLEAAATSVVSSSGGGAVSHAGGAFVSVGARTFDALGNLVTFHGVDSYLHMLTSQKAATTGCDAQLTTVVALPSVLHQASQQGLASVLWVFAVINISIGILNLLPFFPLDGGRVVVALYEGVRSVRRPYRVDMAKLLPVMYTMLTVFVLYSAGWILINLRTLSN
ncbi:MAG TPA: M50 family metallopeptidase [Acidimicrobiales bacterium]|nr:M50 family metallopeptidase [Acidimicrobiales bacterium]